MDATLQAFWDNPMFSEIALPGASITGIRPDTRSATFVDGRAAGPRKRLGAPADATDPVAGAAARDGADEHMRDTEAAEAAEAFVRSVLVDLGDLGLRG